MAFKSLIRYINNERFEYESMYENGEYEVDVQYVIDMLDRIESLIMKGRIHVEQVGDIPAFRMFSKLERLIMKRNRTEQVGTLTINGENYVVFKT